MSHDAHRSLDSLPAGRTCRVVDIRLSPTECQRLMEMGMTIGTLISVLKRAPLGDPIEVLVRGGHLSIRKDVARSIQIAPHAAEPHV